MCRIRFSRQSVLRATLLLGTSLLCLTGQPAGRGNAADEFAWSSSLETASLRAGEHATPLLVIDLAGDANAEPFTSPMGRLLAATTFGDPRIIELSRRRFEVVCRQHGATPAVPQHVPKRENTATDFGQSDNVVFYFCTPDARVLHMAIGFLPADDLLAAAALAERLLRAAQLEREPARQRQAVREWHQVCVDGTHMLEFRRRRATRPEGRGSAAAWDPRSVRQVVTAAVQVHNRELKLRLANHWQGAVLEQAIARLGHHGEVATSFPHLVLSEVPLVPLDTLDQICFEAVTGQPF